MRIFVAGHRGLVGSAITRVIESQGKHTWFGRTRNELDLLNRDAVFEFMGKEKPEGLILAAAKVGGIKANSDYPVEFLTENLQIQSNVLDAAFKFGVEKVVFLGSSCIYPKFAQQPIKEEYLLSGSLEPTNEPYAIAKIAGLKLIQAYRSEYSKNWISAMPTNIYGPFDNFDPTSSHVLPALIRKFHDAKTSGNSQVELWGTGSPLREFLHSEDLAKAILMLLDNYNDSIPINVGSGQEVSIKALAEIIKEVVGFSGDIYWNTSVPDGTPKKYLDTTLINSLGWKPEISLNEGIKTTYEWFVNNS